MERIIKKGLIVLTVSILSVSNAYAVTADKACSLAIKELRIKVAGFRDNDPVTSYRKVSDELFFCMTTAEHQTIDGRTFVKPVQFFYNYRTKMVQYR